MTEAIGRISQRPVVPARARPPVTAGLVLAIPTRPLVMAGLVPAIPVFELRTRHKAGHGDACRVGAPFAMLARRAGVVQW